MEKALRIVGWEKHFENNRTRELKRLDWVPIPNKMDGDGYTELVDHPSGGAHFGAWCAIVEVASKCDPRGTLLREGAKPHDSTSLSRVSRIARETFDEVIPRLILIGWLEWLVLADKALTEIPHADRIKPHPDAEKRLTNGMEANGTEANNVFPDAAALKMLRDEGFTDNDGLLRSENATVRQIQIAVDNANDLKRAGKLDDRRGYIASAIKGKYGLRRGASKERDRADQCRRAEALAVADKKIGTDAEAMEEKSLAWLASLTPEEHEKYAKETLAEYSFLKPNSPTLGGIMYGRFIRVSADNKKRGTA